MTTTPLQGNWVGHVGSAGYVLCAWNDTTDLVSMPLATVNLDAGQRYRWSGSGTSTDDERTLEAPDRSYRRAATWYRDSGNIEASLDFSSRFVGTLTLYALDYDTSDRRDTFIVDDGSGAQTVVRSTPFHEGVWLSFAIDVEAGDTVTIEVSKQAGVNPVLAGIFLDTKPLSLLATHYADVYDFPDTPTATLELALESDFLDSLADAGIAHVTCLYSDDDAQNVEPGSLIALDVLDYDGAATRAFTMIVREIDYAALETDEESAETISFTGPSTLGLLVDGLIEPPGGEGRFPVVDDFVFDFTHPEFDDSAWSSATEVESLWYVQRDADGNLVAENDGNTGGRWAYLQWWTDTLPPGNETAPDVRESTKVIWASDGTLDGLTTGVGDCYFRETFTTDYDGAHLVFFGADNAGELWIDGKQISSVGMSGDVRFSGYEQPQTPEMVSLSPGTHTVAIKATNLPPFGVPNPAGVVASIYRPAYPVVPSDLKWETTGSTKILEYAAETPGMTPGTVLRLMIEAQQNLGRYGWDLLTLDFTDDEDSNGDPWEWTPTLSVKAGADTVYSTVQKLITLYADVRMDPASWTLHAYNKGTGASSGVTYARGGNLTSLRYRREDLTADELLVRSDLGWSRDGSGGRREGYLELGSENNVDEVARVSGQVLGVYSDPREEVTITAEITSADEIPYVNTDLVPRSTADAPARGGGSSEQRIVQLGLSYGADEKLTPTIVLKDRIREAEERVLEMVQQK